MNYDQSGEYIEHLAIEARSNYVDAVVRAMCLYIMSQERPTIMLFDAYTDALDVVRDRRNKLNRLLDLI